VFIAHPCGLLRSTATARDNTDKQLNTSVFSKVKEHQEPDMTFIEMHKKAPAPYIRAKSATDVLEKLKRGGETLNKLQTV
jgi:DNA-nicking Smr family endonuclease